MDYSDSPYVTLSKGMGNGVNRQASLNRQTSLTRQGSMGRASGSGVRASTGGLPIF